MWQEIIVGVCVAIAIFVVVRRLLPGNKGGGGCGSGCGGCSTQNACSASPTRAEAPQHSEVIRHP